MDQSRYSISSYIQSIDNFPRSDDSERVGTVLQLSGSCHDPVFIFDKNETLVGMVSAYHMLYRHSYPPMTKVSSVYMHPPNIQEDTPLYKVMEVMRDTSLYSLPVFDKKKNLLGGITAKDILKGLVQDDVIVEYIAQHIVPKIPITISFDSTVRDVQDIFKDIDISRVIVVDAEGQAAGIVTRKDVADAYISPIGHDRYSRGSVDMGAVSYEGEERYRIDQPIRKFMSNTVYAENMETDIKLVIRNLVESDYNSVILIDVLEKPVGFITIRDVIEALANLQPSVEVPIVFKKPSDSVSPDELEKAEDILYRFLEKFAKRQSILKVEVTFKEPKFPNGDTAEYNTTLVIDTTSGKSFVAHAARSEFLTSIRTVIDEIEKQEERMPRHRKNTQTKEKLLNLLAS